jgi:hypothetical protein
VGRRVVEEALCAWGAGGGTGGGEECQGGDEGVGDAVQS